MFSFSKKSVGRLNLILDVKSSVVRGTLFLIKTGDIPYVLWTSSIEVPYKSDGDSGYMLAETVKALKKIAENNSAIFLMLVNLFQFESLFFCFFDFFTILRGGELLIDGNFL